MTPESFAFIANMVKSRSGLILTPDKGYMLETRLSPLLRQHNVSSLDALALRLHDPRAANLAQAVAEALTTNESSFFRDGKPFEHLRKILPEIARARLPGQPLRILSAACSTGQEAYSIAMVAKDLPELAGRKIEIVGTDISKDVLQRAREGLYTQFEVQRGLPAKLLVQYFRPESGKWRISQDLRSMARFDNWNLLNDLRPLGQFDIIFCRNVLIYFDTPTKSRVLAGLAAQLAQDGVLYLGGAETVLGLYDRLVPLPQERGAFCLKQRGATAH